MSDLELWQSMKAGDRSAFKKIYNTQASGLLSYGRRFTSDVDLVQDCLHDLFVYIWTNRTRLTDTDSIVRYLTVSLRRRIIQSLKSGRTTAELDETNATADKQFAVEDALVKAEDKEELTRNLQVAFRDLSARQKEAIYLKYYKNMGYKDIADVMEISYQSVRNLIYSGLKVLRKGNKLLISIILLLLQ